MGVPPPPPFSDVSLWKTTNRNIEINICKKEKRKRKIEKGKRIQRKNDTRKKIIGSKTSKKKSSKLSASFAEFCASGEFASCESVLFFSFSFSFFPNDKSSRFSIPHSF